MQEVRQSSLRMHEVAGRLQPNKLRVEPHWTRVLQAFGPGQYNCTVPPMSLYYRRTDT